jgi:hypothetical protein
MHTLHNARINLLATAVNNLALAFTIAGFVAPLTSGQISSGGRVLVAVAWIGVGIVLHGCGQFVLGGLRQ